MVERPPSKAEGLPEQAGGPGTAGRHDIRVGQPMPRASARWQPCVRVLLVLAGLAALNRLAYGLWRDTTSQQPVDALTWAMPVLGVALWGMYRWCFKPGVP